MKKKFGTSLLAFFGIISLFFSCASNKQELPPPEYDFTLALRSDGDAYVGNYPEYTLRDISGEYTVEVTEEGEEIITGIFPLELEVSEESTLYRAKLLEGEYRLYLGDVDQKIFISVGPEKTNAIIEYCSSLNNAADALKNDVAPSCLALVVKEKTYITLGYDNLLQRRVSLSPNPVCLDMKACPNITLGYHAFYGCKKLRSLKLPETVSAIDKDVFTDCTSLRYMNIPSSVKSVDGGAFTSCVELSELEISASNRFYTCKDGCLCTADGKCLVAWPAVRGDVELPETVEVLNEYAFSGCTGLVSLNMPGVKEIQQFAFLGCRSLKSLSLSKSFMSLDKNVFEDCPSLSAITVAPENRSFKSSGGILTTADGKKLLAWPSATGTIKIPDGITRIEDNAFQNQDAIKSVTLPASCREIGHQAFAACSNLSSIIMPNVVSIESYAFSRSLSLSSVNIPASVRRCDGSAFAECLSLTNITVDPANKNYTASNGAILSLDGKTLVEWPAAAGDITIPESVEIIGTYAFNRCTKLNSVTMTSIKTVGHHAFDNCSALTAVNMNEGVETIGSYAFCNCMAIEKIVIPRSVKTMKNYAFWFWTSSQTIYSYASKAPSGWDFAWDANSDAKLVWGYVDPVPVPETVEGEN
ncbi:MAG: leucine-rich repeat domain-containing protein [Treponema sp.]|nr:leucine-rich repeat domain-containing protein [Treponema sp.]